MQKDLSKVILQGEANIPTAYGNLTMRAYSNREDDYSPTIVIYNPNTQLHKLVNVRIHSECITGDLFGSSKCECGEQLNRAMKIIGLEGVLLYISAKREEELGLSINCML